METTKAASPNSSLPRQLPPVADLFKQALDVLIAQGKRVIILWLYNFFMYIAAVVIGVILVLGFAFYLSYAAGISQLRDYVQLLEQPAALVLGGSVLFLFLIAISIIGIVYNAALILLVSDEKKEVSPWSHFKQAMHFVWPLFFTSLLVGFFLIGGFFFFFIPYIIFTAALGFYTYVVVLEKKRGMDAIRFCAALAYPHFWPILLRLLVLWVGSFLISGGIGALFSSGGNEDAWKGILQMIVSAFLTMYSVAYLYVLYRQVRHAYVEKPVSLTWMWILSALGWAILIVTAVVASRALMQEYVRDKDMLDNQMEFKKQIQNEMDLQNEMNIENDFKQKFEGNEWPPQEVLPQSI